MENLCKKLLPHKLYTLSTQQMTNDQQKYASEYNFCSKSKKRKTKCRTQEDGTLLCTKISEQKISCRGSPVKIQRTKETFRRHPDGREEFINRTDEEIEEDTQSMFHNRDVNDRMYDMVINPFEEIMQTMKKWSKIFTDDDDDWKF
eukprot:TRINITY_DN10153_c0_g1_i1.p1 TRINITY_DN10153_c0_g1~~TRINITY_DN10153_c0_g1_i1.p1  ORF type:complete len:146 (-),score=19.46 TRINITY_DN10153_c0_g1_i1:33-470(-)